MNSNLDWGSEFFLEDKPEQFKFLMNLEAHTSIDIIASNICHNHKEIRVVSQKIIEFEGLFSVYLSKEMHQDRRVIKGAFR